MEQRGGPSDAKTDKPTRRPRRSTQPPNPGGDAPHPNANQGRSKNPKAQGAKGGGREEKEGEGPRGKAARTPQAAKEQHARAEPKPQGRGSLSSNRAEDELSIAPLKQRAELLPKAADRRQRRLTVLTSVGFREHRATKAHKGGSLVGRPAPCLEGKGDEGGPGRSIPPTLARSGVAGSSPVPAGPAAQDRRVRRESAPDNDVHIQGRASSDIRSGNIKPSLF